MNDEIKLKLDTDDKIKQETISFKNYTPNKFGSIPKFGDSTTKMSYEDLKRIYPPFSGNGGRVNNCVLFWDDVVQFVTLGAMDLFNSLIIETYNEEKNIEISDKTDFYVNEFFNRKNELIDGFKFMFIAYNGVYSTQQIRRFIEKFYKIILTKAPFSGILPSIGHAIQLIDRVTIVFNEYLDKKFTDTLISDLYKYFNIKSNSKRIDILFKKDYKKESDIYKFSTPSVVFTPNGSYTLNALLELDIKDTEIFTNIIHNGLSPDFLDIYVNKLEMSLGPNRTRIHFYEDQIHVENPEFLDYNKTGEQDENT